MCIIFYIIKCINNYGKFMYMQRDKSSLCTSSRTKVSSDQISLKLVQRFSHKRVTYRQT